MQKYGLHYPVLLDPADSFVAPYGVNGVPETFIIDRNGHVVAADTEQMTQAWLDHALEQGSRHAGMSLRGIRSLRCSPSR